MSKRIDRRYLWLLVVGTGLVLGVSAVFAHHSTAEFDYGKTVILHGTVKEVQWLNPHSYLEVMVPDEGGKLTEWSIEYGTPNVNVRMGWRKDSVKAGDKVTLNIAPTRDGKSRGTLRILTAEGGHQLKGVAATVSVDKEGHAVFGPGAGTPPA